MRSLSLLFYAILGLIVNMSFAGSYTQPDWCLAILLASLLSHRESWRWVLPCACLHDLMLYDSVGVTFPYLLLLSIGLTYIDQDLGQGQPQRWLALCVGCFPLWLAYSNVWDCLLTMALTVMLWSLLSHQREKAYVEPA